MIERSAPPARMRYSYETRCRAVQALRAGWPVAIVAAGCGAARATVYRWWVRYRSGGWDALRDRPSTPLSHPRRLPAAVEAEILAVRERSGAGPQVIAALVGRAASTVGKVLRRHGRSRLPRGPRPLVQRYERERPGELVHLDTKKLGRFWSVGKRVLGPGSRRSRGAGWQYVHLAVDDHSRLAYAEVLPREDGAACAAFLRRALAWYAEAGVAVERVLTDNARAYRSHAWREAREALGVEQRFTRPYTPRTNGKPVLSLSKGPSASSRCCCGSGPTPGPIPRARTERGRSRAGCGGTTGADPTAHSAASRPSAASHTFVVSTARLVARSTGE